VEGTAKQKSTNTAGQVREGSGVHRYWYSPEARSFVAYEYEETDSKGVVTRKERDELLSYRFVQ
jgi:hypothetical protein